MAGRRARGKAGRGLPLLSKRLADDTLSAAAPPRTLQASTGPRGARSFLLRPAAARRKTLPMLKIRIIPCLDVKDGRVVKGVKFVGLLEAGDHEGAAAGLYQCG